MEDQLVGYASVIVERYEWIHIKQTSKRYWEVTVTRLSDGEKIYVDVKWRWAARRFVRSSRRMRKEFEKQINHHKSVIGEEHTLYIE